MGAGGEAGPGGEAEAALRRLRGLRAQEVPMTKAQAEEAAALVRRAGMGALAGEPGLGAPARPVVPAKLGRLMPRARLRAVQAVISGLQYNHTPEGYFNLNKRRPFTRVMDTAREILREALPIKCLEAVFLGLHLTCGMEDFVRIPVSFKTRVEGRVYRHIVLAVRHVPSGRFGALGLSRREELMFKDLSYASMSALLDDFLAAYEKWWHEVLKVWVGLPASHEAFDQTPVCWRFRSVHPASEDEWREAVDEHVGGAQKTLERWRLGLLVGDKGATNVGLDARPAERSAADDSPGRKPEDRGSTLRRRGSQAATPASPIGEGHAGPAKPALQKADLHAAEPKNDGGVEGLGEANDEATAGVDPPALSKPRAVGKASAAPQ